MRVLLIEDDPALGSAIRDFLSHQESCVVDCAGTLAEARTCVRGRYAVILLDIGLPDGDGLSLLPRILRRPEPPAVLVLTSFDSLSDRVRGLDSGADDYLVKPFDLAELGARVRAVVRRRAGRRLPLIELGALRIDPAAHEVTLHGKLVELTPQEYALMLEFTEHPRRVLSRSELEDAIYRLDGGAVSNVVEVVVSRLRRKLGRDAIQTVRGVGYRWGGIAVANEQAEA